VDLRGLKSDGKTDQAIMREIVEGAGLASTVDWPAVTAAFLAHMPDAVRQHPGEVCPGVRPLLATLAARGDMALALGTGNFERGARIKLAAHDLDRYFPTGGFGDDGLERTVILQTGMRRAEALFGVRFQRVVAIGDTPHDARAAAGAGAWSLCVATGPFSVDDLSAAGATVVRRELTPAHAIVETIEALPASPPAAS
jgi:phosphoglycolate phosphatase